MKKNNNKSESFADIIKNDPSRKQELLDMAATLLGSPSIEHEFLIDPEDALNNDELANFRKKGGHADPEDKAYPVIIVSSAALKSLINNSDFLVFYLGKYPKEDTKRIDRYNVRNQGNGKPYTYKMLGHRFTFVIQAIGTNEVIMSKPYDMGRLCPPPSTGCF